ncbi:MAG TPA: LamG-like jellyroll fold domain-containing protein, partial [Thermoplasmata archaeon]|nr:LamG-like jellyroll fold domain-containing protein [Thermoplasmata archaeon]
MANDGNPSTYWQSSSTTGWLAVAFPAMTNVNEVHVHFHSSMSKVPPGLSVYFDTSGNGQYETGERVWYTTTWSNNNYDVIRIVGAAWTKGIKFQIDTAAGNKVYPRIAELEAYLRYDSDGDGLTNDQELSTTYYQDMRPSGLPTTIPDDGVNTTASSVSLTQFYGSPAAALANFSVDHARRTDVTAQVGYWNGSAWIDRYVWDPGKRLDRVSITNPTSNGYVTGNITVVASVLHPEITSKVEFRVGGVLSSTVTTPVGSEYRWTWNTAGIAEGPTRLNTTQYDTVGGKAWSEITVNVDQPPQITWVSPAAGSTVSDTVTVKVTATDSSGISFVNFYVDGLYKAQVLSPNSGTNGYAWSWGTSGYCSNAQHTLKAIAREAGGALLLTYSPSVNVTANTFPLVCITSPTDGSTVRSLRTVTASPTAASGKTISKVDFYLDGSLQFTATASPWSWSWDTTLTEDGWHTLSVTATDSASKTASSTIAVDVANGGGGGGGRCPPICPTGPVGAAASVADGAGGGTQATTSLGVLTSEWTRGETDSGTASTVVVDLVNPQALASAGENASRILRPALPVSLFASYLSWRLVIRDWSQGTAGTVTAFTLRFEVKSDPNDPDTDGDGLADGTEASRLGTLPVAKDSDLDGLDDYYETVPHSLTVSTEGTTTIIAGFVTNPTLSDTDGDGLSDAQERGFVTTGQSKVVGEVGRATGISGTCGSGGVTTVFLRNRYTSAVVIAQPATWNEHDAGVLRVKAVGDHSFDVCFQEWSGSTTHGTESVDYLVVEAGNHILPDGTVVEAGRISAGTAFATSLFREGFAQPPILLAQVQSYADPDIAAARVRAITFTGFDARIRVNAGDTHPSETLGYVAISPQSDPAVLAMWTRGSLTVGATTNPATVAFPKNFSAAPRLLAWYATEGSTADLSLRVEGLTNASATLRREISGTPAAETLHWFAFANSMNLTARMTTRPNGTGSADTDGDTLADGTEVNTYGSNPTLKDTDADGIADNVEVTSRTITIPVNGTSKSFTFKTSPTSDDTDADGIKDPDELAGILDHRALSSDMQTVRTAGILRDLSGNGGDGSILGATCASSVAGRLGYACSFAGSTARIQFADSALVDLTSSFSITAWVYPTTTSQPGGAGIVAKGTGGGGESYALDVAGGSFRTFFWKSGLSYVAQGTTTFSANTWYLVAAVYDGPAGVLRLYINAGTPVERTGVPSSLAPNNHVLTIGSRESSATSGYNLGFIGRIDEVSIWDRPLSASEIKGYYNLTNSPTAIVAWLDVETRDASNNLFDFSATSHTGVVTGTTVLEGRSGLARSFRGGTDGILLSATTSVSFTGGVSASLYILISSYPTTDASVFGRKGDFYLNLTSDGRVRWSIYTKTTIASPLPIPLNRWVRIVVTAGSAGSSLLLDGVQVASTGTASAPLTASTSVTLGYAEGIASRFIGAMDEILVLNAVPASANTLPNLAIRGILLNPNGTDTDGDRLADGQELFVKSMKTPKRYPIPDYSGVPGIASTASMAAQLSAPAAFLASATAMVGITHTFMGDLIVEVHHVVGGTDLKYVVRSRIGGSTDNNFTSYDMLNAPLSRDRQDFVKSDPWYLLVSDNAWADTGVIEYLQIQLLVHTLPNRADTDGDGLNDSEEINLGSDGFATDPWKADTDADGWSDGYETLTKGTNPVAWDTDGDGVRDSTDLDPLHDLLVAVKVKKVHHGASPWCTPELAGVIRVNDAYTWVTEHRWATEDVYFSIPCLSNIASTAVFDLTYYADVPDDIASASVRGTGWSVDGLLWDDVLVDGSITYTLNSGSPSCTLNSGVSSCTLYNGYSWMTFDVWTVALPKAKTLFVTDGNTTITLANGQSRLVGQ